MRTWKKQITLLLMMFAIGLSCLVLFPRYQAFAGHEIYLRDVNGTPVTVGGNTPYSPKQTCGLVGCHIDMVKSFGLSSGNIYESGIGFAQKDHGPGSSSYSVPYPQHGVSAGFHFQKGKSSPWGQVQRDYYKTPDFASSPGMYGKFCLSTNRKLADLNEDSAGFDFGSYDFSHSECGWCHAGGGPLEYDREGYRYDGLTGLFKSGANPNPKNGDYYSFDLAGNNIISRTAEWQSGGVAEVDCLLCHLQTQVGGFRFSMLERNFAISEAGSPGLAASLGLAGPAGTTGFLRIARQGDASGNPEIDRAGWSWATNRVDIKPSPDKENCALCHFADKSLMMKGPAGVPLGYTVMQKLFPAHTVPDGDNAAGGTNAVDWKSLKLRAEADKRAESLNDSGNANVHMNKGYQCTFCHSLLGTARNYNNDCVTCHYQMWGYPAPPEVTPVTPQVFPALVDASGNTIQPAMEVLRIDHQLAKGNNKPDGMLMDQLDNTVTCEGCHITKTHKNSGAAPSPAAAHADFPSFHFSLIDCRTCHIPLVNGPIKRVVQDYTSGTYQGGDRHQLREDLDGIGYKPLYAWRARNLDGGNLQIVPLTTMTTAVWQNRAPDGKLIPVFQRAIERAAEAFRVSRGATDGFYNWTLNRPQNGDAALIVNTQPEISGMVNALRLQGESEPVMTMVFEQFVVSHNEESRTSGKILGAPSGGGCLMCHASSDPASPSYSPKAVGFFDKQHILFDQPVDGGRGIVQTSVNDGGGNPVKRVEARFVGQKKNGSPLVLDLSHDDGQSVGNVISQGDLLGYDPAYLAALMDPLTVGIPKTTASFAWNSDGTTGRKVNFDASSSVCSGACAYSWEFGDGSLASGLTTSHVYASAGMYSVTLTVEDTQYGFKPQTTSMVEARTLNTAPVASKTSVTISSMAASFRDTSTDAESAQADLVVTVNWGDGTTTNGSGGALFTKTYSAGGSYVIRHSVSDPGGLTGSSPNATVTITEKFSIAGTTVDGAGAPLPNATISLKIGTTVRNTTKTGANGAYAFNNLLKACYTVVPSMTGRTFTPVSKYLCVGPSATSVNFTSAP